jgi:ribosome-binding factor A
LCSTFGEPILEVTDVEVSPDLGYARVYWTLPVTMEGKPLAQVRYVTQHIQRLMDETHGRRVQHLVAGRLRQYRYVPKLRFVPELTELTHSDIVLKARRQLR